MKEDPFPLRVLLFCAGLLLFLPVGAHASAVFEMSDGTYYSPSTGLTDTDRDALIARVAEIEGVDATAIQMTAQAPVQTTVSAPTVGGQRLNVFKMGDGRYFYPATGMLATTEEEIYRAEGLPYPPPPEPPEPVETGDPSRNTPLLRAVDRAKTELTEMIDRDREANGIQTTPTDDIWVPVTLAVWNKQTDALRYVDAKKRGTQLEIASGNEDIFVRRTNYINSEYAISDPNSLVVGVRYPILKAIYKNGVVAYYEMHDAAYAPYSRDLDLPEVAEAGKAYLDRTIDQAYEEMREAAVPSRAYPGKLMADVVDKSLIKSLLTIEHTDLGSLQTDADAAVNRVFVTLGLNTTDTFNYAKSSAGAFGLMQFIPSTYASFASRPQLGLIQDFEAGLKNHVNAVRATAAHLDDSLASLPSDVIATGMSDDKVKEYLAAAYNGGYSKVRTAIQIWDEQISGEYQPYEILSRSRLYPETINYVKKLRAALPVIKQAEVVQLASREL